MLGAGIEKLDGVHTPVESNDPNAAGDNWESVFHKHVEDNLDMYFEELNKYIEDSYPDGDSASGVVLLLNGEIIAGEASNI